MAYNNLVALSTDGAVVFSENVFRNYAPYPVLVRQMPGLFRSGLEDGSGDASVPLMFSTQEQLHLDDPVNPNDVIYINENNHRRNHDNTNDDPFNFPLGSPDRNPDESKNNEFNEISLDFVLDPKTVFVTGMPTSVSKHDIDHLFSQMGSIQKNEESGKPKIFAYKNKFTGQSRGEATVTFVETSSAQNAIMWLNNKIFGGKRIKVSQAFVSTEGGTVRYDYQRNQQSPMRRNRKKIWRPAADNWICCFCHNSNFVWRLDCNRCKVKKSDAMLRRAERIWRPISTDWLCGFCFNTNFRYRYKCNRCNAPKENVFE